MSRLFNDGSTDAPKLQVWLNLDNLTDLRSDSLWPGLHDLARDERLRDDGFSGVQLTTDAPHVKDSPLPHGGLDRINEPGEADSIAAKHAARGIAA